MSVWTNSLFWLACLLFNRYKVSLFVGSLHDAFVITSPSISLFGLNLCVPHHCHFWSLVDACWFRNFVCKRAMVRSARRHALNDLRAQNFSTAGIPVTEELLGLFLTDGLLSSYGCETRRYAGTPLWFVPWPNLMSMEPLARQVWQQRLLFLARRQNVLMTDMCSPMRMQMFNVQSKTDKSQFSLLHEPN